MYYLVRHWLIGEQVLTNLWFDVSGFELNAVVQLVNFHFLGSGWLC